MDWELRQSEYEIIPLESSCAAIQDNFGVPNTAIQRYLNVIFPGTEIFFIEAPVVSHGFRLNQ